MHNLSCGEQQAQDERGDANGADADREGQEVGRLGRLFGGQRSRGTGSGRTGGTQLPAPSTITSTSPNTATTETTTATTSGNHERGSGRLSRIASWFRCHSQ